MESNKTRISKVRLVDFDSTFGLDRGASKLKEGVWYLFKMVFFLSSFPYPSKFKTILLRLFGAKIGKALVIKPRVNIHFPWKLVLGDQVWLGEEVLILNFEPVNIEDNVCISQRAFLCGGNHDYTSPSFSYRNGPIYIQAGSWVGAGVFVGPDVTIGYDAVITAGSVVTNSLDPSSIYQGSPAKKVRERIIK